MAYIFDAIIFSKNTLAYYAAALATRKNVLIKLILVFGQVLDPDALLRLLPGVFFMPK
jgi:hypothetical protein